MVPDKQSPENPRVGAATWLAVMTTVATTLRLLVELVRAVR